jgi:large subunit ribosomal protein L25
MITKEITAAVRESFGKGSMRRLRAAGKTPGVVYSGGDDALPLEFETKVLFNELLDIQGRNAVITLKIDNGSEKNVIVREIQTDPVKDFLYHTDFLEIDLKKATTFSVPINYTGKAIGVDLGGFLNTPVSEIELQGEPLDIPDECVVDISNMAIDDSISVGEIKLPKEVSLVSDADKVCVYIGTEAPRESYVEEEESLPEVPVETESSSEVPGDTESSSEI